MKTNRTHLLAFGPGSKLMLAGIVAAAIYGAAQPKNQPFRLNFEADSHGRLQRVDLPSTSAETPHPWKPEPAWLIENATQLHLSAEQRSQVQSISIKWEQRRDTLSVKMRVLQAEASQKQENASTSSLQDSLAAYSEISRSYDQARIQAWNRALSCLKPDQMTLLERLAKEVRS